MLTLRDLKLTLSSTVFNHIILAEMFFSKTLNLGGVLQVVQVIQRGRSPNIVNAATEIYDRGQSCLLLHLRDE